MTPQEVEEIKARHQERVTHYAWGDGRTCEDCKMDWPCEQAILLARIEELEKVVAAAREAKQAVLKWANTCDHIGCECDNVLADELPDDWMARAALGGEDG